MREEDSFQWHVQLYWLIAVSPAVDTGRGNQATAWPDDTLRRLETPRGVTKVFHVHIRLGPTHRPMS